MECDNAKPINLLDEGTLREYIKDTVRSTVEEMLLNEMAFDLKTYKDRIRNHAIEIAINWCLVRYTFYNEQFLQLRKHWMTELKTHLNALAIAKVSSKNQSDTKYKAVLSVWAEFEFDRDEYSISGQIANKFEAENIDIHTDTYATIVDEFKNETRHIADVIASGDRIKVNTYVNNLCNKE